MKLLRAALLGLALAGAATAVSAQNEQFIPMNGYWVGPYAPGGSGIFGGMIDYVNMINARDGGVGSILGSFLGAAFITLLPIFLNSMARPIENLLGVTLPAGLMSNLELIVFGALIIFFLIVEPHGLARLWQIAKEKLRLWPFPH